MKWNRKHSRQIERHRRNKGPVMFSQAADTELQDKAKELAKGLSKATIETGNVAAASLLLELAEGAEWAKDPATRERVLTLGERLAREPEVVELDTAPQLPGKPPQLQLTSGEPEAMAELADGDYEASDPAAAADGSDAGSWTGASPVGAPEEILEAEVS